MVVFDYLNGVSISEKETDRVVNKVIETLKTELPEEAQCYAVVDAILDDVKQKIKCKKIVL